MPSDPSQVIEIENSPRELLAMGGIAAGGTVLFAGMVLWPNIYLQVFFCFAAVAFGFMTIVILRQLLTVRGPVVTITPDGIRDIRVAAEFIPWTAVRKIRMDNESMVTVLVIDPAVEQRLTLTTSARWRRAVSRRLRGGGLIITASGLKIGYHALFRISQDCVWAAQGATPARASP